MTSESKPVARKSPEWLKKSVIYQLFLRAFTPEGTLKAAERKLPELAELGVDIVYLCPICLQDDDPRREYWSDRQRSFDNPKNPYRIKDFYAVDPEYGSDADLKSFVDAAHKLGMRVMLDLVYMHCGPSPVFLEEHPDFVQRNPDGSIHFTHYHFPYMNLDNPELREYLWRNMEYWIEKFGVDGYRCDVADAVALDFWETARDRMEKLKPDVIMLAEGHRVENFRKAYDMNYDFPWTFGLHSIFNRGRTAKEQRELAEKQLAEAPEGALYARYLDNHDIANDTSSGVMRGVGWNLGKSEEALQNMLKFLGLPETGLPPDNRIDKAWGNDAVDSMLALCFALDGVPMLYNGQEVADAAKHSIYCKFPVDWANGETPRGKARRALVKRLCALRHSEKALSEGSIKWLDNAAPDQLLSFERTLGSETILAVFNVSKKALKTGFSGAYEVLSAAKGSSVEALGPYGYFIGKAK